MRLLACLTALALALPAAAAPNLDYDLTANLPLAHVYRGGVVADAAATGFVKYIRDKNGRWKLGAKEDGRKVGFAKGPQSTLWIPVGPELIGKKLVIEAIVKPIGKQRMDAFLNGKKIGSPKIESGWQAVRINVPEGAISKAGIAMVRLHFSRSMEHAAAGRKTASAIRAVRVGLASTAPLPVAEKALAKVLSPSAGKGNSKALNLPDGAGLDYYITPVKGLKLVGTASGGTVKAFIQVDGGKVKALGGGAKLDVSLNKYAGKAARLMLRGVGDTTLSGGSLSGAKAGKVKAKKPKYVVFWLIDTLRADKLKFYSAPGGNNRPKVKTPNLDALAKSGSVFEPFWVQGNESKASHASLFTGLYPVKHGVYTHKAKLKAKYTTIAEAFKAAGYRTGGFVSNGYISKKWHFDQGFRDFQNFIREGKANNAKAVVRKAKPWITKHKGKPFYLYLGTSDPHVTYRQHKEFIGQYDTGDKTYKGNYKKALSGASLGKMKGKKRPPRARDRKRIEALYENEIAFNDKHFGDLVAHLKSEGIFDETLIIISADHGDEFWEHGGCGHGHSLHQELVNVPLVLHFPGVFDKNTIKAGTDGVDLLPTLLELLGAKVPSDVQGESVLSTVGATHVYPRAVMASQGTGSYALQAGPAKVIMRSEASIKVFDVKKDPEELKELGATRPVLMLSALDPLSLYLSRAKSWKKAVHGVPNNLKASFK